MKMFEKARFDTRTPKDQKEYNAILASKRDRLSFFNAMMSPQNPNARLKKAASHYKEAMAGK